MPDHDTTALDIVSRLALDAGIDRATAASVDRVVDALLASPGLRTYLRAAVQRDLAKLVREWRGTARPRSPARPGLIPAMLARSAVAATSPEATVLPVFEPGKRGWLSLVRTGANGDLRPLLEWTREDLLAARDAYRQAGRQAQHHAQFLQGLAEALPEGARVGDVFSPEHLARLWDALSVTVSVTAQLDRAKLARSALNGSTEDR